MEAEEGRIDVERILHRLDLGCFAPSIYKYLYPPSFASEQCLWIGDNFPKDVKLAWPIVRFTGGLRLSVLYIRFFVFLTV